MTNWSASYQRNAQREIESMTAAATRLSVRSVQAALEEQATKKKNKKKKADRVVIQGAYLFGESREEDPETEHDDLIPPELVGPLCPLLPPTSLSKVLSTVSLPPSSTAPLTPSPPLLQNTVPAQASHMAVTFSREVAEHQLSQCHLASFTCFQRRHPGSMFGEGRRASHTLCLFSLTLCYS
jgi:hypothetical protein